MSDDQQKQFYQTQLAQLSLVQKQALAHKLKLTPDKTKGKLVACLKMLNDKSINSKQLKAFAEAALPEHFIPQVFQQVLALPKTPAGKVNRKQAQHFAWQVLPAHTAVNAPLGEDDTVDDDDFDIFGASEYIAPTNDTEAILAKIWSDVLGVGDISIHDEFIEVGGDSLFSIRILARINKAGLSIATEDFFEYPTIAGQAKAISQSSENSYEQGSTKGTFDLLPIQHWLFERVRTSPQHWNQSVLLAVNEKLDFASLERAFQKVLLQHDALRLAFVKDSNDKWQQSYLPLGSQLPIEHIDFSNEHGSAQGTLFKIEQHCTFMNQSMDLTKGDLARIAFFTSKPGEANTLAIVVHHLIIDAESWRILLEDLQSCWLGFAQGAAPSLPRKTTSFKHWSEKLIAHGQSNALMSELDYWQAQTSQSSLPVDFTVLANANNEASCEVVSSYLDTNATSHLLHTVPKQLSVEVKDILICALVIVVQRWTNHSEVLLDIEGHGRENLFDNVNISRTVGWFTTVFPTVFSVNPTAAHDETLLSVKKALKAIPNKGIGHGILRENRPDAHLKQQPYSQICFNYLGQIDAPKNDLENDVFTPLKHNVDVTRSPECLRAFYVEVNTKVQSGKLHIDWSFSHNVHKKQTIEKLSNDFMLVLNELLAIQNIEAAENKDDDPFDLVDLESDEMDAIARALSGEN